MKRLLIVLPFLLACSFSVPANTPPPAPIANIATAEVLATPSPTETSALIVCSVIANKSLNLRDAPSTSAAADRRGLSHGEIVILLESVSGWYRVQIGDRTGWAKAEYMKCP